MVGNQCLGKGSFFGRNGKAERFERAGSASRTGDCGTSGSASRTGDYGTGETSGTSETSGISDC